MTTEALEAQLAQAMKAINALPADSRGPLLKMVEETRLRHEHVATMAKRCHNAIDNWRLIQKYRIFDAEATLRERAQGSA